MVRDFPTKVKLATLVRANEEEEEEMQLGSLLVLSSFQKKEHKTKGMMFTDIEVARQWLEAPVDTGASDLFMVDWGERL